MPNHTLTQAVDRLAAGGDLASEEAASVLREIMEGRASDVECAGFLIALRTKGETVSELVGLARTMRELCAPVDAGRDDLLDTAGTGGGRPTFNVSTAAAIVAAGAGCVVAKHGNRSATGRCGSADVLEALGARLELPPASVADCIRNVGFGFMFAPQHHAATRHVVGVRRQLAVRTAFNLLGPLTNPAGATLQLIGVSDASKLELIASTLRELGCRRALVVASTDGLDELSVSAPTWAVELAAGELRSYEIDPAAAGISPESAVYSPATPDEYAAVMRSVLAGDSSVERSVTVLNAGAAIYVADQAESIAEGVARAQQAIDSGRAADRLDRYVQATNELAADR